MSHIQFCRGGFTFVELVVVITVIAALAALGLPVYTAVQKRVDVNATKALISAVSTGISTYQTKTWTWEHKFPSTTTPKEMRQYFMWDLNHRDDNDVPQPDIAPNKSSVLRFYSIDGYTPGSRVEHDPTYAKTLRENKLPLNVPIPQKTEWDNGTAVSGDSSTTYDGNFPPGVLATGYRGFLNMVSLSINTKFINKRGNVIDAWGNPLRIQFGAKKFGTEPNGIWSPGYDLIDDTLMDGGTSDEAIDYDEKADDLRSWQ